MASSNGHKCNDFKAPSSLKDVLDFFAKLAVETNGQSDFTNAVLDEIKKRLSVGGKGWIRNGNGSGTEGIDWFYKEGSNGSGCVMPKTIRLCNALRNNFLVKERDYGKYNDITDKPTDPCVKKYADAIIENAFPLFGCLFYLWFM